MSRWSDNNSFKNPERAMPRLEYWITKVDRRLAFTRFTKNGFKSTVSPRQFSRVPYIVHVSMNEYL